MESAGMPQLQGWFGAFLAEAYLLSGRAEEARDVASRSIAVTEGVRFWYGLALAHRALGRVALAEAQHAEAEEHFRHALQGFSSLRVPFEVGRTHLDLARLAQDHLTAGAATAEIEEAHRLFVDLGVAKYAERTGLDLSRQAVRVAD
jgi:hypothetical protein